MKKVTAIYPGSFDPPTNGHLDLVERGSKIFDELIVAVLRNSEKTPLFSIGERRNMLDELTSGFKNVSVDVFDGSFHRGEVAGPVEVAGHARPTGQRELGNKFLGRGRDGR